MSQNTFDVTLTDATETDLQTITGGAGINYKKIKINTDNDAGTPNGFHTVNSGGDTLTLRAYSTDIDGNDKLEAEFVVDQGQSEVMIPFDINDVLESDMRFTAQLSSFSANVRITGRWTWSFDTDFVDVQLSTLEDNVRGANDEDLTTVFNEVDTLQERTLITTASVENTNNNNDASRFDTDLAGTLGQDDVLNRAQVGFGSPAATPNGSATNRDIVDYADADGTIFVDVPFPTIPSVGDEVLIYRQMSTIVKG